MKADVNAQDGVRPYIVKTYDRWIILAIVLIGGWFLFRPIFGYSVYYRGVSFENMGALPTAEHYYRKAIGVYPKNPEAWQSLGELYMMKMRASPDAYAGAIDTFTRGGRINPSSGALQFDLCRTYYEGAKDYRNALSACRNAVEIDSSIGFAWDYAGWSSLHLGDRAGAVYYWRETLKRVDDPAVEAAIKKFSH